MKTTNSTPTDSGFDVPAELGSDQPASGHTQDWKPGREDYAYFEHGGMTIKCQTRGIDVANGEKDIARVVIGDPLGEGEANFALLISAPRLLRDNQALKIALEDCDLAFTNWQIGQIPGRPEDILSLIAKVRAALALSTPSPATSTPKPPSDAATGAPEGEE